MKDNFLKTSLVNINQLSELPFKELFSILANRNFNIISLKVELNSKILMDEDFSSKF